MEGEEAMEIAGSSIMMNETLDGRGTDLILGTNPSPGRDTVRQEEMEGERELEPVVFCHSPFFSPERPPTLNERPELCATVQHSRLPSSSTCSLSNVGNMRRSFAFENDFQHGAEPVSATRNLFVQGSSEHAPALDLTSEIHHSQLYKRAKTLEEVDKSSIEPEASGTFQIPPPAPDPPPEPSPRDPNLPLETAAEPSGALEHGDLLSKVLSYLNQSELAVACQVSRPWRAAAEHEDFWCHLSFHNRRNALPADILRLCRRYPRAKTLNLVSHALLPSLWEALSPCLGSLETLVLGGAHVADVALAGLRSAAPRLRKLMISAGNLGSRLVTLEHDWLEEVEVVGCSVDAMWLRCPNLERLSLSGSSVVSVQVHESRGVRALDLSSCRKMADVGFRALAASPAFGTALVDLNVSNCSGLTNDGFRDVALLCPNLTRLHCYGWSNFSLSQVSLPALKTLELLVAPALSNSMLQSVSHAAPALETLILDGCFGLKEDLTLEMPCLATISLRACTGFSSLSLSCPRLTSLLLERFKRLKSLSVASATLPSLVLRGHAHLKHCHLDTPSLTHLQVVGCDKLADDVWEPGGLLGVGVQGCQSLETVEIDDCESFYNIALAGPHIRNISVLSCQNLDSLQLSCPSLNRLSLDGCHQLTSASMAPVGLSELQLGTCPLLSQLIIVAPEMTLLDLKGCGALEEAALSCPNLVTMDAFSCAALSDESLSFLAQNCPMVRHLVLAACTSVSPDGLRFLAGLRSLEVIDLSYTFLSDLDPLFSSCLGLKVLRVSACKDLRSDALVPLYERAVLPCLEEIDVSYSRFDSCTLENLMTGCRSLLRISINGCHSASDSIFRKIAETTIVGPNSGPGGLAVNVGKLEVLNAVGCPSICSVMIPCTSAFSNLQSINLSLASKLTFIRLACPRLELLNLSKCKKLCDVELSCPQLRSLSLTGCNVESKTVMEVLHGCPSLESLDLRDCARISSQIGAEIEACFPRIQRLYYSENSSTNACLD